MRKLLHLALITFCAALLSAQETPTAKPVAPPPLSFKQVLLFQFNETEKKLVSLAEAIPEEKYAWRPADGVRSISEVIMHEAGANVFFLTFIGVKPPAGF